MSKTDGLKSHSCLRDELNVMFGIESNLVSASICRPRMFLHSRDYKTRAWQQRFSATEFRFDRNSRFLLGRHNGRAMRLFLVRTAMQWGRSPSTCTQEKNSEICCRYDTVQHSVGL